MKLKYVSLDAPIIAPGPAQDAKNYLATEADGKPWMDLELSEDGRTVRATSLKNGDCLFIPITFVRSYRPLQIVPEPALTVPDSPAAKKK